MTKSLNDYFDQIYCINIKTDKYRMSTFDKVSKLIGFKYKKIEAITPESQELQETFEKLTGRELSSDRNPRELLKIKGQLDSLGALGCSLSHLKILKDAIKNDYKNILLLEDDVLPSKNFKYILENFNPPEDYDFLYLGGNLDGRKQNLSKSLEKHFYNCCGIAGTYAWAVSSHRFKDCIDSISQFNTYCDRSLERLHKKFTKTTYVQKKQLFIPNIADSNIRAIQIDKISEFLRLRLKDIGFSIFDIHPDFIPKELIDSDSTHLFDSQKLLGIFGNITNSKFLSKKNKILLQIEQQKESPENFIINKYNINLPEPILGEEFSSSKDFIYRFSLYLDELFIKSQIELVKNNELEINSLLPVNKKLLKTLQVFAFDLFFRRLIKKENEYKLPNYFQLEKIKVCDPYCFKKDFLVELPTSKLPEDFFKYISFLKLHSIILETRIKLFEEGLM